MDSLVTPKRSFVTAGDLYNRSNDTGYAWLPEGIPPSTKVIQGRSDNVFLNEGLSVHYSHSQELDDLTIETDTSAHIGVRIFLEGQIDASIGGQAIPMPRYNAKTNQWQPVASVFSQLRDERFYRRIKKGDRVRKVIVSMTHEWLENRHLGSEKELDVIKKFTSSHLASKSWAPSPTAITWAEQIINPPAQPEMLLHLYMESRALGLIAEAFQQLLEPARVNNYSTLRPQDRERMTKIKGYVESHATETIKTSDLADIAGISVNTLQRLSQSVYGVPVSEAVRRWRLERARSALEFEGVTIAEAAYMSGYGSPANFSTAFKRHFGISPSDVTGAW